MYFQTAGSVICVTVTTYISLHDLLHSMRFCPGKMENQINNVMALSEVINVIVPSP